MVVIVYSVIISTKNAQMSESEREFLVNASIIFVFVSDFDILLKISTNLHNL